LNLWPRSSTTRLFRRARWTFCWLALLPLFHIAALAADEPADQPQVTDLGDNRYRIGQIVVDREAAQFSVPGEVLDLDRPLEYIAVSEGGRKAYESLLAVQASGTEFNLACILIGLDAAQSVLPKYQFDREPVQGQAVDVFVEWDGDKGPVRKPASALLSREGAPIDADDWRYTGGATMEGAPPVYLPDSMGTLIGFVHDPASVIDHREGLGIGAYGSLQGNPEVSPPKGSAVRLIVQVKPESG